MPVAHLADSGRLFDEIAINYVGAEAIGIQPYRSQSKNLAMVARMLYPRSFEQASVLDVACGFGITTLAIAGHNPKSITSIDPSESLTSIARMILQNDEDIAAWLTDRGGVSLLGSSFQKTVEYLVSLRNGFKEYFFCCQKKQLTIHTIGLMEFQPEKRYDSVILNNALHWIVTKLRKEKKDPDAPETVRAALVEALRKIRGLMNPGGVFTFLSPKVFLRLSNPDEEDYSANHWFAKHPIIEMLNLTARGIFEQDGKISKTGAPPIIYHQREMARVAEESGFRFNNMIRFEESVPAIDALDYFKLLVPINLGDIEASMLEKVETLNRAASQIGATARAMHQNYHIYDQQYVFALVAK